MSLKPGDKLPAATFKTMGKDGPENITSEALFSGKKVVLFAVPGAYTPGCTVTHLPGFVVNADKIKAKGVDTIACVAVNDVFVLDAWKQSQNAEEIVMLADGNGDFTKAIGMELDASGAGMGTRSKRLAMIVEDGKVTHLGVDQDGGVDLSSADKILEQLK